MFRYDFHIDYSRVDNLARLSLDSIFDFTQIAITEYFKSINFDNLTMKNKYNYAWVISKTKLKINSIPMWGENVYSKIFISNIRPVKTDVETIFYDLDGNELIVIKDEMCIISLDSRKVVKLSEIGFDKIEVSNSVLDSPYESIDMTNLEKFDNIKVKYCDIDCTNHTNNVSYIRFIMNSLGIEFFNNYKIVNMDLRYLNESRINESLDIYKSNNNNTLDILIKREDTNIFSLKLTYKLKEE
jgi:medium-chain acyl-[acyl-carrier-protein] hydrolase